MSLTKSVKGVVLIIGLVAATVCVLVAVIFRAPWWACVLVGLTAFLVVGYTSTRMLWRYIIYRIKPVYQLLLSREIETSRLSDELRKRIDDDIITDIQQALDHLVGFGQDELERLKQKEKERSAFLISIFHELRTPIFTIEGYAQTLLNGGVDDPEVYRQYLGRMVRSVERLTAIVEDIDRIARYESGGGVITYWEDFCVNDMLHEVVDTVIVGLKQKDITCTIHTEGFGARSQIPVHAERLRIFQLVEELLVNATRYCDPGGKIDIRLIDMFEKVLVEVSDDGCGIPAWAIPRVFEPFFMVDESRTRSSGGPGLGLPGVKGIVEAHGESITLRSEVGVGSTFSFTLTKAQ